MFLLQIKSQETAGDVIEDAVATAAVERAVVECPPASDNALTLNIGGHAVVFDPRLTSRVDDVSLAPTPKRKHAIEPEQVRRPRLISANILHVSVRRSLL